MFHDGCIRKKPFFGRIFLPTILTLICKSRTSIPVRVGGEVLSSPFSLLNHSFFLGPILPLPSSNSLWFRRKQLSVLSTSGKSFFGLDFLRPPELAKLNSQNEKSPLLPECSTVAVFGKNPSFGKIFLPMILTLILDSDLDIKDIHPRACWG